MGPRVFPDLPIPVCRGQSGRPTERAIQDVHGGRTRILWTS